MRIYSVCFLISRQSKRERDLIAGAATTTSGNIVIQDTSHDSNQFRKKLPVEIDGKLAIPAAISDVNPDWMTPKTKWLWRRGIPSMGDLRVKEADGMPLPYLFQTGQAFSPRRP